jgi:hypothetical protein
VVQRRLRPVVAVLEGSKGRVLISELKMTNSNTYKINFVQL